ncbi:AMP-binding protein [Paracoccaceae bacterium]|nr:AMP-binding protein [Paracoccaceae bacterium]
MIFHLSLRYCCENFITIQYLNNKTLFVSLVLFKLQDGWLHTGDLGTMDAEGCVSIVDRKKDMILTGGYNVYPAEIERVLAAHPAVALAAVGKLPDDIKGEIAKAYIVLKTNTACTEDEIIAFCRETLAAYKCPRKVQFVDDVPKTSTGKIMRRELHTLDI